MKEKLKDPHHNLIYFQGPGADVGPLPAFIYFVFSAEESLNLSPYNRPAVCLEEEPIRVFSFTIPGHEEGLNKFHAMAYWAEKISQGAPFFEPFFDEVLFGINWLVETGLIDPQFLAVGGLSRGGFVATHIAARDTRIKTLLTFAPLTELNALEEFAKGSDMLKERASRWDLARLCDHLTHLQRFRAYIGNRDLRVNTDACYKFIRKFSDTVWEKRARHCQIELKISSSIGFKGHGTSQHNFDDGALWIKNHLVRI